MSGSLQPVTLASLLPIARASNAWRFNASGVLEQIGADIARLDHDPATLARRGLLIEPQATNIWPNPRFEASIAGVIGSGGRIGQGTNIVNTAGGLTWEVLGVETRRGVPGVRVRVSGTAAGGLSSIRISTTSYLTVPGTPCVVSAYLQLDAGSTADITSLLEFHPSGQVPFAALQLPSADFLRRSGVQTFAAGTRGLSMRLSATASAAVDMTFWFGGLQIETDNLTSVVLPPAGSPAASTRLADALVRTLGVAEFSAQGFTLVTEGLVDAQAEVARHLLALDDNTANNAVAIRIPAASSAVQLVVANGGVETVTALGSLTLGAPFRVAARCAPGAFLAALNGAAAAGNAAAMPPVTRLRPGRLGPSGTFLRGHLRLATLSRGLRAAAVLPALSVPGAAYL